VDHTQTRKDIAVRFLQLVVSGRIAEAYDRYVDMQGKHHNPHFPAGFPALKKAMIENHVQFPDKQLIIKNVIGDGELVAVHSRVALRQGENDMVIVHLYRFRNDKIVELWDCGMPVPADSPNTDGAM